MSPYATPAENNGCKSGWRTLPLELRQQILDNVLSDALIAPILDTALSELQDSPIPDTVLSESQVPSILDTVLSKSQVPSVLDSVLSECQVPLTWDEDCCWSGYPADERVPLGYYFEVDTPHAAHLKAAGAAVTARTVLESKLCTDAELEVVLKSLFKRVMLDAIAARERFEVMEAEGNTDVDTLWFDSEFHLTWAWEEFEELRLSSDDVLEAIKGLACYDGGVGGGTSAEMATENLKGVDMEGREEPTAATQIWC